MRKWIELRRKAITIGNSRGFVIPKSKLPLKSNTTYIIKLINEEEYHEIDKQELIGTKTIKRFKLQSSIKNKRR